MFESWSRWVDGDGGDADALEHVKPTKWKKIVKLYPFFGLQILFVDCDQILLWIGYTSKLTSKKIFFTLYLFSIQIQILLSENGKL